MSIEQSLSSCALPQGTACSWEGLGPRFLRETNQLSRLAGGTNWHQQPGLWVRDT